MLDENYTYTHHLDLSYMNLPEEKLVHEMNFKRKEEFHMTVIGNRTGKLLKALEEKYGDVKKNIEDLINSYQWDIEFYNEFYLIKAEKPDTNPLDKKYRYSIIKKVRCDDLINLFETLNENYPELNLEEPFPHVTFYTFNDKKGIGIYTEKEFEEYKVETII